MRAAPHGPIVGQGDEVAKPMEGDEEEQAYWDAVYDYEEQKCAEYYGSHNPLY